MPEEDSSRRLSLSRLAQRELVLLVLLSGVATGLFLLTRAAAAHNRTQRADDAAVWFRRGTAHLAEGCVDEAVIALRRAMAREPNDWAYARALAEALVARGQPDAAQQVLRLWRVRRPDDADVNAQLARLEARSARLDDAVESYQRALAGNWGANGAGGRDRLREELIGYLLSAGRADLALPEVAALAANQANEPAAHIRTGRLFLRGGDPARALDQFQRALRLEPRDRAGRAGAGEAAFAEGQFSLALGYLRGLDDEPSRARARMAALVVDTDPLLPRLSFAQRLRRLTGALTYAAAELDRCRAAVAAGPDLDSLAHEAEALASFQKDLSPERVRDTVDVVEHGVRAVGHALAAAAGRCGPMDERGQALRLAARAHGLED